jgi:hypothetical protein
MNILWVEDNPENKKDFWFGDRNVTNIVDFSEADETIKKSLNNYDIAVLDIDLSNSDKEKVKQKSIQFDLSPDNFLQKSGMILFLTLLERGFPREQVIFLTGNSDKNDFSKLVETIRSSKDEEEIRNATEKVLGILSDEQKNELKQKNNKQDRVSYINRLATHQDKSTYGIFRKTCNDICIKPPEAISKSNDKDAQLELKGWLDEHEKNDYLTLRRGIIKGCNFLKKHIKDDDNNIQFRSFVKGTKINKPAIEILPDDIKNYLDTVTQFLPARQPTVINDTYRLFLRTLVHEWEESIDPQETTEKYGGDIHTFAWLSKQTRNWVSHAKLLEPLNSQIIAFLFLVNMRAMFKLPVEVQEYEYILLKCISKTPPDIIDDDNLDSCIKDFHLKVDEILSSLNIPLDKEIKDKKRRKYFSEKINDIYRVNTGNSKQRDYQGFLFQCFWVSQQVYQSNLTANSDDFLPTLARHIYNRSFS